MTDTLFRDVIFNVLLGFVALALIMLPHINPKGEDSREDVKARLTFEIFWDHESDADVDMWILDPEGARVGYSNKNGGVVDLLRDDIGHERDPSGVNAEIAFARAAVDGEYILNAHMFDTDGAALPLAVQARVSLYAPSGALLWRQDYQRYLRTQGDEVTIIRITLRDRSIWNYSELPRAIRTERSR